jgi:hypothetical protein
VEKTFIQVWRAGAKDRSKGAAREIAANQQDRRIDLEVCRAWLSVVFVFLRWAIFPGREPKIIIINLTDLVFPSRFFQGLFTRNILCKCVWFLFNASAEFIVNNLVVLLFDKCVLLGINGRVLG